MTELGSALPDDGGGRAERRVAGRGPELVQHEGELPSAQFPALVRALERKGAAFAFSDADGEDWGFGAASVITATGAGRFLDVRHAARALLGGLERPHSIAGSLEPRLFGGFAFGDSAPAAPWDELGAARFVLPRVRLARRGDRAFWALVTPRDEQGARERWLATVATVVASTPPTLRVDRMADDAAARTRWLEKVERAVNDIARGRLEKVVLAREARLSARGRPTLSTLLERLAESSPASLRFALAPRDAVFFGATPELLLAVDGQRVETEALAGSAPLDAPAGELLGSEKNRREQRLVVADVVERLRTVCTELSVSDTPELRVLRHVQHLRTPIVGQLREGVHALDVLASLHPTPAVGGVPRQAALEWLARHEGFQRGWYAGPVGWLSPSAARFHVAIRSALFHGGTIRLFAGAGLVAGSDPAREWLETRMKLGAMLEALEVPE